jgi:hypothetical protein
MPTPTPATALAAVLNELSMLSRDPARSAESWRAEVQKIIDTARPLSAMLLEREGDPHPDATRTESAFLCQLRRDGQAVVGIFDDEAGTYRTVTVSYDPAAPRLTASQYRTLLADGVGCIGPDEPITYVLNDDDTGLPVLSDPDHGPLTDEEVEVMLAEGWGDGR